MPEQRPHAAPAELIKGSLLDEFNTVISVHVFALDFRLASWHDITTGQVVKQQFDELASKNGVPVAILSDAGSDLNKGTRLFQAEHPEVVPLYDIKHLASRAVEKIMKNQEQWESFRSTCTKCANAVRQSKLAHLKPPRPKTKQSNGSPVGCWWRFHT